jgi:hypothetical protein
MGNCIRGAPGTVCRVTEERYRIKKNDRVIECCGSERQVVYLPSCILNLGRELIVICHHSVIISSDAPLLDCGETFLLLDTKHSHVKLLATYSGWLIL